MKILIIRPYASVVNTNLYNMQHIGLAKAFIRQGCKCDIIYWSGNKGEKIETIEYKSNEIKIFWMNGKKIGKDIIYDIKRIEEMIRDYDIVQTEEYEQLFSCILSIRHPEKVVVYHGPYDSEFKKMYSIKSKVYDLLFKKRLISRKVQFITKSNKARNTIERKGIKNVYVSPVGLDLERFPKILKKNKNIGNTVKLLYIGELSERRSIDFLIEVLFELIKSGIAANLTIVGKGNPQYVEYCKNVAKSKKVDKNIIFKGPLLQTELPQVYNEHDIFLLATKYEIFGMVLLEAMYFGCVVITTCNGGSQMVVKNGENGFIINELDAIEWVNLIKQIYVGDYNMNAIRKNAHKDIENLFSWDESAKIFLKIYKLHLDIKNN